MTRHGIALVALTELRRSWRQLRDSARGVLLIVGGLLFGLFYGLIAGGGGFFLAANLAGPDPSEFGQIAFAAAPAGLVGFIAFVVFQRAIKKTGEPDGLDGLLTATDHRTVTLGVVLAETGRVIASLGVIGLAGAIGVGAGVASTRPSIAGAVVSGLLAASAVGLSVLALTIATVAWAYALGQAARYVLARSRFVSRHRSILGIATTLVGLTLWIGFINAPGGQSQAAALAAQTPLGWWPDLVGLVVPGLPADPLRGLVGAGVLGVAMLTGPLATVEATGRTWYLDSVQIEASASSARWTDWLLPSVLPPSGAAVARKSWLRALRSPFIVQFAIFPYFFLIYQITPAFAGDPIPPTLAVSAGLATAVGAGAAFSLNPLGGEGDVLPVVLIAAPSGTAFVTGLALAGALPGVVLTVIFVGVLGIALGTAPLVLATGGALAVASALALPAIATGIGAYLPKFETNEVSGTEVVVPSGWAFAGYLLVAGVVLAPGLVGTYAAGPLADLIGVSVTPVAITGLVASITLLAVCGVASLAVAARRFERYTLA
ncbi:hypothetical protein [Halococcoides cellulosivorans]|uniref:Uncharacterized protein n=1 Tax=Halococcoides cellulosivorans TaxID=1679096 RepID=A0A2R4X0D3_9EURY|nr:hypothetical protein [Halococcoides cellulosivorans]AWB27262.1 hypothetical protein HARCEL1_05870 [Halococcoides cellulosivorans]